MRKIHFLLLGALAVLVLGATVQQMTTENAKDWPTATPKSTNTVLGVYDGGVARQFQLSTIGSALATNTGTDGQALLRSGNSLKFGDVATSGGVSSLWSGTNVGAVFVMTTNTTLVIADTTSAGFTVTLPSSAPDGFFCAIKLIGTNSLTVTNTVGLIDGSTNLVMDTQYQARTLARYSTNWWIY